MAEIGAALARRAGLAADGQAVADDATVAETLIRLARELDGRALALGAHGHSELRALVLGGTLSDVLRRAPCPVLVCTRPKD
jgi:nucleotide-binding universal stress UspA family protein